MSEEAAIRAGISIGDIAGVGPELILRTFSDERVFGHCIPVLFANPDVLTFYQKTLETEPVPFSVTRDLNNLFHDVLNVYPAWTEPVAITPGKPDRESGKFAVRSLEAAAAALKEGAVDVLVTAPINKHAVALNDFAYPGHTEYLQQMFKSDDSLMFMVSDTIRVSVVTGHMPLREVPGLLTGDRIASKVRLMHRSLREDFGIDQPKIAVLGLNPHAGDDGTLGWEDLDIIQPAIVKLRESGMHVNGPFPADGFFGNHSHEAYDGVLAMYHDQGLIPFKYIAGMNGVNFTAGLPVVRTSPDHGTAEDIAGKGCADPGSFRSAVYAAIDIFRARSESD